MLAEVDSGILHAADQDVLSNGHSKRDTDLHFAVRVGEPAGRDSFPAGQDGRVRTGRARGNGSPRGELTVTIILLVSALIGAKVLALFGIGLPAFQVGGGIILFLISLQMTLVGVSSDETAANAPAHHGSPANIAIVPLAIPLLAGPAPSAARSCTARERRSPGSAWRSCAASSSSSARPCTAHCAWPNNYAGC